MTHTNPDTRHDFVILFDVRDGNPNGDPDADNMPRIDPETRQGLVTDVSLKRKVRDYAQRILDESIFIQSKSALNTVMENVAKEKGIDKPKKGDEAPGLQCAMIEKFYDIRMFGAVLTTGDYNAGQVRGPVQLTFARSLDPIYQHNLSITRQARTTEERQERGGTTEIGRKAITPYGLYRAHGFYNPYLAKRVSEEDLEKLWEALERMYEFDRSAARGDMAVRGLYVFTHQDKKGNAHAHKLFENIAVKRTSNGTSPRAFTDYTVTVNEDLPNGVTLTKLFEG
ncbi:MAG: type I-C CRISPR-associated protein Cas7/Csd2 [Truepera sp.]|nr:type I-C CRISPR-associated protein Cas7/Csd2 [Truepera sp.]